MATDAYISDMPLYGVDHLFMPSVEQCIVILVGGFFISIGINFFLLPYRIMDGGFIGIALIFHYLFGFRVGGIIILCSIPVFLISWVYERAFPYGSLLGMLFSSFITDLLEPYSYSILPYAPVNNAIIGGILVGTGLGVMLRKQVSTGGTDMLAQFIVKKLPLNVGYMIFVIDAVVVGLGGLFISTDSMVLSLLTIISGALATVLCTSHSELIK